MAQVVEHTRPQIQSPVPPNQTKQHKKRKSSNHAAQGTFKSFFVICSLTYQKKCFAFDVKFFGFRDYT
jgi:hypothetical protein